MRMYRTRTLLKVRTPVEATSRRTSPDSLRVLIGEVEYEEANGGLDMFTGVLRLDGEGEGGSVLKVRRHPPSTACYVAHAFAQNTTAQRVGCARSYQGPGHHRMTRTRELRSMSTRGPLYRGRPR